MEVKTKYGTFELVIGFSECKINPNWSLDNSKQELLDHLEYIEGISTDKVKKKLDREIEQFSPESKKDHLSLLQDRLTEARQNAIAIADYYQEIYQERYENATPN